jgi:type II secretion system protein N
VRSQIIGALKYVLYPLFYLFALVGCVYLTFPWDALRHRIEAEFAAKQAAKGDRAWRLVITDLDGYWFSGVELTGAKIIMPPEDPDDEPTKGLASTRVGATTPKLGPLAKKDKEGDAAGADGEKDAKGEKEGKKGPQETVVLIESAHARVRMLPLLIGRVRVDFHASVFGGEVSGVVPVGGGDLEVELANIDLAQITPLRDVTGIPLKGTANGKLELSAPSGKWSKSTGSLTLAINGMVMGDGKAKFRELIALPPANVGTFEISARADSGLLKLEKFDAQGQDVELHGEGTIKLKDGFDASVADLWLRFGFSEEYKQKDDRTQALFVDDGPFPALISQDKKMKRAKRPDGLWGFHVHGKLSRLRYDATSADGPKNKGAATGDSPLDKKKKKAKDDDDDDTPSAPTTPPRVERPNLRPKGPDMKQPGAPNREPAAEPAPEPEPREPDAVEPEPAPAPEEPSEPAPESPEPAPAPE